MQIVIDIPEEEYNECKMQVELMKQEGIIIESLNTALRIFVANGTPLPQGHGRLIDADRTLKTAWTNFYKHEDEWEKKDNDYLPIGRIYDQNGFECCQQTVVNAPTIIEADKAGEKE